MKSTCIPSSAIRTFLFNTTACLLLHNLTLNCEWYTSIMVMFGACRSSGKILQTSIQSCRGVEGERGHGGSSIVLQQGECSQLPLRPLPAAHFEHWCEWLHWCHWCNRVMGRMSRTCSDVYGWDSGNGNKELNGWRGERAAEQWKKGQLD